MKSSTFAACRCASRRAPLAMCLSAALTLGQGAAIAASPAPDAMTRLVKNCDDPGNADSLRQIVASANSGDTIDLGKLPTYCGTPTSADVTVTLSGTEIATALDNLYLAGPSNGNGSVTISGGGISRVLHHTGAGILLLTDLTIADGHVAADNDGGGCIKATEADLLRSNVTGCSVIGADDYGGGISATNVGMLFSTVSNNTLSLQGGVYGGGGIATKSLTAKYSAITGNTVSGTGSFEGGGVLATTGGNTNIRASTIDNNRAIGGHGGGLASWSTATIANSTISGNSADQDALTFESAGNAISVTNSTIAFNHATLDGKPAGISLGTVTTGVLSFNLESSIVAMNTAGSMNTNADLFSYQMLGDPVLSGSHNLVMQIDASITPPTNFLAVPVATDRKLRPLAFNGGPTRTHALMPNSPARGNGSAGTLDDDQRGPGYPRSTTGPTGATTDIGAYEYDSIFADGFH